LLLTRSFHIRLAHHALNAAAISKKQAITAEHVQAALPEVS